MGIDADSAGDMVARGNLQNRRDRRDKGDDTRHLCVVGEW